MFSEGGAKLSKQASGSPLPWAESAGRPGSRSPDSGVCKSHVAYLYSLETSVSHKSPPWGLESHNTFD